MRSTIHGHGESRRNTILGCYFLAVIPIRFVGITTRYDCLL